MRSRMAPGKATGHKPAASLQHGTWNIPYAAGRVLTLLTEIPTQTATEKSAGTPMRHLHPA
ncbi:hypothetical protein [Nitrosomonas halophila]|uniref:hypothetical protein n=1 Tax=Nitrosomonas halophila TaxID=44576 RepID=UPI0015A28C9E|nr:hypothetical protein [Nitrosomonas halophila]